MCGTLIRHAPRTQSSFDLLRPALNDLDTAQGEPRRRLSSHACERSSYRVFPLAEAAAAHEPLDPPERFGKILLAIDESRL